MWRITQRWPGRAGSRPASVSWSRSQAAKLLLHLATASRYGYFGDELYFLACGEHLDWGYVDQPPLVGLVAWVVRHTLGTSLLAIRSVSALAGAALVLLTGLLARELGGGRFAMGLSALASGSRLRLRRDALPLHDERARASLLDRVRLPRRPDREDGRPEALALVRPSGRARPAEQVLDGRLRPRPRRRPRPEPGAAGLSEALDLAGGRARRARLPAQRALERDGTAGRFSSSCGASARAGATSCSLPLEYVAHQVLNANPAGLPLWLAGLGWLLLSKRGRAFRPLGTAFLVTLGVFILTKGKDYYVTPAFATLFAAGGVALEGFTAGGWRTRLRPGLVLLYALTLPFLPFGLPILPPDGLIAYQERLGITLPATEKAHARAALPHHFAWQFGWPEMVAAVAATYHAMPPEEQARVAIIGNNYGDSGAIDLLGPRYGLPMKALGTHQSYWLWGPGDPTKDVFIVLGDRPEGLKRWCEDVEVAAELSHPWTAVWENRPVLVCRRPKLPLAEIWRRSRHWG